LDVGRALVAELDPEAVLVRIVEEARGITGARYAALGVLNSERTELERFLTSGIDAADRAAIGALPRGRGVLGVVIEHPRPLRLAEVGEHPRSYGLPAAHPRMHSFLGVPILIRGQAWGNLYLTGKDGAAEFSDADEEAAVILSDWAATAIENARLHDSSERRRKEAEADRLRAAIAAAEAERSRWARELHDQTLQALGSLRVLLASCLRRGDEAARVEAIHQSIADIELEIDNLRGIITDLRPSLLDDLGLLPAIEALIERRRAGGLEIEAELELPAPPEPSQLSVELETTVYRLVQESLTNVVKHARAEHCSVSIRLQEGDVHVEVADDGAGFDPVARNSGFGLAGMRERIYLAGGVLHLNSGAGGTLVRARIPAGMAAHPTVTVRATRAGLRRKHG